MPEEIGLSFDLGNRSWMHMQVRPETKEVHETRFLPEARWSTEELIDHIQEKALGFKNPVWKYENDYGEITFSVSGWRPMNDSELKQFPELYRTYLDRIESDIEKKREMRRIQYQNLKAEFGE